MARSVRLKVEVLRCLPAGLLFLAALSAYSQADRTVSADELKRCAAISAANSRLACYDALAGRPASPVASNPAAGTVAPPATAGAGAPAAAAPKTAAALDDPKNFGLNPAQQHIKMGPESISASINSIGGGGVAPTYIDLDNGQSWIVMDADAGLSRGDKVTIKRASLGSFLMTGRTGHKYRVRRAH